MSVEFHVVGGYLKLPKTIFIKDMLNRDSCLRQLLNWSSTGDFSDRHPAVSETDSDGMVKVDFSYAPRVSLGESPDKLLGRLKASYREKVKGRVVCRGTYFGFLSTFELNLDSDDDKVEYIAMNR